MKNDVKTALFASSLPLELAKLDHLEVVGAYAETLTVGLGNEADNIDRFLQKPQMVEIEPHAACLMVETAGEVVLRM